MISLRTHQHVSFWTRIVSCIIAGASLALFTVIFAGVFDKRYVAAQNPGLSILPVGALALLIFWNIIALTTVRFNTLVRLVHPVGDIISFLALTILGPIGFAYEDRNFLSNAMYKQYDFKHWLIFAIVGGSLAVAAIVVQLLLIIWDFMKISKPIIEDEPPLYDETIIEAEKKEKEILDWESLSSQEGEKSDLEKGSRKI